MTEAATGHPNDEWLVAYLTTGLSLQEHRQVNTHLRDCDQCVHTVAMIQHRLRMAAAVAIPVPVGVRDRAAALAAAADVSATVAAFVPAPASRQPLGWIAWLRDQLAMVPRFSFVVPGAVAATALLVLVTHSNWIKPAQQGLLSRSIPMHQRLRVSAPEASVRSEPATNTPVLATLRRGTPVQILSREGEWYRIELPDGRAGWMEGRAFE